MAADPLDNPELWLRPTLDGQPVPGTRVVLTSGGERALKVEQAQMVGYAGAFTAVRGEEMTTLSYRIECADAPARAAVRTWLEVMRIGQQRKGQGVVGQIFKPAVYRIFDPALEHNQIANVLCKSIGRWYRPNEKSGLWAVDITFAEWKKPVKIGGIVAPRAKTQTEQEIENQQAQNKALEARVAAAKKEAGW